MSVEQQDDTMSTLGGVNEAFLAYLCLYDLTWEQVALAALLPWQVVFDLHCNVPVSAPQAEQLRNALLHLTGVVYDGPLAVTLERETDHPCLHLKAQEELIPDMYRLLTTHGCHLSKQDTFWNVELPAGSRKERYGDGHLNWWIWVLPDGVRLLEAHLPHLEAGQVWLFHQ